MSFIQRMRRSFGTEQVVVVHRLENGDEERNQLESQVQARAAFFDVDAPVYEGDRMEIPDPRGGTRVVWITDVRINQVGGAMSSSMSHIEVHFEENEPTPTRGTVAHQIIHGDAIIVSGDHVNVATRGSSVQQQMPVAQGYEDLARAVKEALELIESDLSIDGADRTAAGEASSALLAELVKEEPNHAVLRGLLTTLRGVVVAGTNAAAAAVGSGLVHQLLVH